MTPSPSRSQSQMGRELQSVSEQSTNPSQSSSRPLAQSSNGRGSSQTQSGDAAHTASAQSGRRLQSSSMPLSQISMARGLIRGSLSSQSSPSHSMGEKPSPSRSTRTKKQVSRTSSHVSVVHPLASSQRTGIASTQRPATHSSLPLQKSRSSQSKSVSHGPESRRASGGASGRRPSGGGTITSGRVPASFCASRGVRPQPTISNGKTSREKKNRESSKRNTHASNY